MIRKKVLMLAYACNPGQGSEPGIGWNIAKCMADHHDVWVITRSENRFVIEKEIEERQFPNLTILYHDFPNWVLWLKRGGIGVQVHYYLWQLSASRFTRGICRRIEFDVAHHVTYGKFWAPAAAGFTGVPFIWGPVGGGESMPGTFFRGMSRGSQVYEWIRSTARWIGEHDPFVRATARRAKVAISVAPETTNRLRRLVHCPVIEIPAVALGPEELQQFARTERHTSADTCVTLMSVGRLLGWKGYHLAIRAFAQANLPDARYVILGGGPEKGNLKALAKELGVQDRVEIVGSVPRPEVLERLGNADIFLHPSLHDSGGWATLEAMAAGLPVICLDIGGPAVQVNSKVGRKIAAITPDQAVEDLSKAMRELATDSDLRRSLGEAAQKHVAANFTWKAKAEQFAKIYEQVLS